MVRFVKVTGFSRNDERDDKHLTVEVFLSDGRQAVFETTGKMLLKDIIEGIVKEIRRDDHR